MKVFLRVFLITFIVCAGYFIYALVGKESYSPTLKPNENAIHNTVQNKQNKQASVKFYFLNADNKPVLISKDADVNTLENALKELLSGSGQKEYLSGNYSEIPKGTKLLSLKEDDSKIAINLSKEFEGGGGAQSIQARLLQIVKTISLYSENKPVYLYIEGKKAEYLGGEGIFVEQPLNEEALKI